ncbi:MAG: DoxX family protein [Aridibacter sp.]
MKTDRIIYYISTGLLSVFMVLAAGMYIFKHNEVAGIFTSLGFPTYIIYPLATAKLLGTITLWSNKLKTLKEWAYAGFFFNFILALSAHLNAGDGGWLAAAAALVLLITSYIFYKKL